MSGFLLLQARDADDPMAEHEQVSFANAMQVQPAELTTFSLITATPDPKWVDQFEGVLIGGSGAYSARGDSPWVVNACDFARNILVGQSHPTFAVCFGLQLMGRALGQEVIHDPDNREVGSYLIHSTEAIEGDPLFGHLPETFWAQQGHNDRIVQVPAGTLNFGFSERAEVQAFRVIGRPVWATQSHPELDMAGNRLRYMRYIDNYGGLQGAESDDPVLNSLRPTPLATELLARFVRLVRSGVISRLA
ncbi:MAG TPA: hypothetical protein DCQ06_14300 [Myxococcales bacterium]|nr:hypothetical protein [Myxococcales bacterium]